MGCWVVESVRPESCVTVGLGKRKVGVVKYYVSFICGTITIIVYNLNQVPECNNNKNVGVTKLKVGLQNQLLRQNRQVQHCVYKKKLSSIIVSNF